MHGGLSYANSRPVPWGWWVHPETGHRFPNRTSGLVRARELARPVAQPEAPAHQVADEPLPEAAVARAPCATSPIR
jgi:hypothetical protein